MLSHRNKLCFTGGMIEGELDFIFGRIAVTSRRLFSSICTTSWNQREGVSPWQCLFSMKLICLKWVLAGCLDHGKFR